MADVTGGDGEFCGTGLATGIEPAGGGADGGGVADDVAGFPPSAASVAEGAEGATSDIA